MHFDPYRSNKNDFTNNTKEEMETSSTYQKVPKFT